MKHLYCASRWTKKQDKPSKNLSLLRSTHGRPNKCWNGNYRSVGCRPNVVYLVQHFML